MTFTATFSQSESDWDKLIGLVVSEYKADTIQVYHKFENSKLIWDLKNVKSTQDMEIYDKFGTNFDIVAPKTVDDTVTVKIENIKVVFYSTEKTLKKKHNKRVNKYTKETLLKRKNEQYAYISIPLISIDKKYAIIYSGYYCGGLCGNGGIFYLENINGVWKIINYERRWIS